MFKTLYRCQRTVARHENGPLHDRGVFIWSTSLPRGRRCTLSGAQPGSFTALRYG
jgi:hypothetical protein